MFRTLTGCPAWYQAWAALILVGALYLLVQTLTGDGLTRIDYAVMVFVSGSVVLGAVASPARTDAHPGDSEAGWEGDARNA